MFREVLAYCASQWEMFSIGTKSTPPLCRVAVVPMILHFVSKQTTHAGKEVTRAPLFDAEIGQDMLEEV